jgi:hypothetical protein
MIVKRVTSLSRQVRHQLWWIILFGSFDALLFKIYSSIDGI